MSERKPHKAGKFHSEQEPAHYVRNGGTMPLMRPGGLPGPMPAFDTEAEGQRSDFERLFPLTQDVVIRQSRLTLPAIKHPRDLLPIRTAVIEAMGNSTRTPAGLKNWLAHEHFYELYFTRPDFADLHKELRASVENNFDALSASMLADIVEEKGDHGAMIIAFDDRHQAMAPLRYDLSIPVKIAGPTGQEAMITSWTPGDEQFVRRLTPLAWVSFAWSTNPAGRIEATGMTIPSRYVDQSQVDMIDNRDARTTSELIVFAWMMLTAQTQKLTTSVVVEAGAGLPPKAKKDLGRSKRSPITVIDLRRTVREGIRDVAEVDSGHRHLDHRFIVRGHWRHQACGVGRRDHKLIFVAPFIKGPEGAPFVAREKVFKY